MKLGIDIGSVAAKAVVLDESGGIVQSYYVRTKGQPVETILALLEDILQRFPPQQFDVAAATGTGGELIARILDVPFINEIIAQAAGTARFHPDVRTIIEIGGQDSKLIMLDLESGKPRVTDFALNGACAAGTGSFLDQQASRMGIPVEDFGDVALQSAHPPPVAGRCSVFAKSDMIHLQQIGTPVHDILAGLCFAMVRNFKGQLGKGRQLARPVSFQGGVAANKAIRRAILEVMELNESDLIIPEYFAVLGALGSALVASDRESRSALPADTLRRLRDYLAIRDYNFASVAPLRGDNYPIVTEPVKIDGADKIEAYVGVDIGSISTNVVVIDRQNNILSRRYIMTASRPIEAVRAGLYEVWQELGERILVKGTGSTGSGRYMTGEFFGADVVRNEISSHAKAAAFLVSDVDTIFEIGGQDAKYISLQGGTIVDFAMNKVCAAGTGSFLEEQAEKLGIKITDFGDLGLASKKPLDLGERCTVFMESQLNFYKLKGAPREDMIAGLAYSVVKNYITKVVEDRRIGDRILFQGGVAFNRAAKAAFEAITGKEITVPPHHDILGAVGVAMLAHEEMDRTDKTTRFRGFDLRSRQYELSSFECKKCANHCEVHRVVFDRERPLFYGARCDMYDTPEKKQKQESSRIPRLFDERAEKLQNIYPKDLPEHPNGKKIGIARSLFFHDLFPLWKAFFTELGFQVVTSDPTTRDIMRQGAENVLEEPCLPIKLTYGHVLNVLDKDIDILFLPVQCTMEKLSDNFAKPFNCPLTQSVPFIVNSSAKIKAALSRNGGSPVLLRPVIHADRGRPWLRKVLRQTARQLGIPDKALVEKAITDGFQALDAFEAWEQQRGQEILSQLKPDERAVVVVGRSYNTCDPGLTLDLPRKLHDLDILAIPLDFLPLKSVADEVAQDFPNMYWKSGQKMLCAGRIISRDPRLFALYITNFACGPDAYLLKFFSKETGGKPFLTIEMDEHSADAGVVTRCEAFLDTIRHARTVGEHKSIQVFNVASGFASRKRVYLPYMIDHGYVIASAMRYCGVEAEALPESDDFTLETGRRYTTGKECYPSIITTGDIVKKTLAADFDPDRAAFFMPSAKGPCRFGQYNKLHRIILDDLGLPQVPMLIFDQTGGYHRDIAALGSRFRLRAWQGITILDYMHKMLHERRPYEVNKGETDAVYHEWLDRLVKQAEMRDGRFESFAGDVRRALESVKIDRSQPKPRIGVVGEIFVRSNQFANEFVVRRLEKLGAECSVPPLEEWLDYTDFQRKRRARRHLEGGWREWAKQQLTEIVQERTAEPLRSQFDGAIGCFGRERPTGEILKLGHKYLTPAVEGEAILSMGRTIEYAEHGFNGILNVIPFGCMPGTIAAMLMHQFRRDYGLPVFTLVVEGTKDPSHEIRLEAFYEQCCEHLARQGTKKR